MEPIQAHAKTRVSTLSNALLEEIAAETNGVRFICPCEKCNGLEQIEGWFAPDHPYRIMCLTTKGYYYYTNSFEEMAKTLTPPAMLEAELREILGFNPGGKS